MNAHAPPSMRAANAVKTTCPYCGVGCTLQLHVQENDIVRVTSPLDHDVTRGHLCIKGRFGWQFVQITAPSDPSPASTPKDVA